MSARTMNNYHVTGEPGSKEEIYNHGLELFSTRDITPDFRQIINSFLVSEDNHLEAVRLHALGGLLEDINDFEEAIYFFTQSILYNPDYHQSYHRIGESLHLAKQYSDSRIFFDTAIQIVTKDDRPSHNLDVATINSYKAEYLYCIGLSFLEEGDYHQALQYFLSASDQEGAGYLGYKSDGYDSWDNVIDSTAKLLPQFQLEIPALEKACEKLLFFNSLTQKGKDFYLTSEFLFNTIPAELDHSATMVSYCKVLEVELEVHLHNKFIAWCNQHSIPINIKTRVTLGSYKSIVGNNQFMKAALNTVSKDDVRSISNLQEMLTTMIRLRNSSAHRSYTSKENVNRMRGLINGDFFTILFSL